MKIVKFLLYTVLVLFVIYVILCIAGPKEMGGMQTKTMKASPASILEEVTDFSKWMGWSPWHKLDTTATYTFSGTPGTVGHKMTWDSKHKHVLKGSQELIEIRPDYARASLNFMNDTTQLGIGEFKFEPMGDSTKVTWGMLPSPMPFMMRGMAMVMNFQGMMMDMFNQGLTDLKAIVESKPMAAPMTHFDVVEMGEQWYVGQMFPGVNFATTTQDDFMKMYDGAYAAINAQLASMKTTAAGPYISIAHNFNDKTYSADIEIAIPVADSMAAGKGLTCGKIPAGKSAKHAHNGGYAGVAAAWEGFMGAVMGGGNTPRWSGYEVYMVGPGTQPDSTLWVTHLVQPIK
ncbi:MAG: SRPBCC family protein [Flavobacteriales bacterium]|nr:SRPBCC family protein [Flavobacteriales bacterium]